MSASSTENSKYDEGKDSDVKEPLQGIEYYPERRGGQISKGWFKKFFFGKNREEIQTLKCERQVHNLIAESPLIKFMLEALSSSGCPVDLNRHISCEPCSTGVTGGYDAEMNQIVICQNCATSRAAVHGALAHEMVHMFDFCRANIDYKNLDHLLCTEIRAANLMHCSFLSALSEGSASLLHIKKQHQECVKKKATSSVMTVRKSTTKEELDAAMDRVFTKCYNDLEPLGRRLKRSSKDVYRVYRDRYLFGYGSTS